MNTQLSEPTGQIHRLDPDGSVHAADPEFRFVCSNGIAFSPDDEQMYFGDTKAGQIFVYDFDLEAGRLSNRRLFFDLRSMAPAIVDGATVDAEGFYWFALNHGGKIIRLDPKGRIDREIVMPIPSPTCVGFGGDDLETLFVTSQQAFVTPEQLAKHPQPGSVFAVHGLGVRGLPEPLFGD